MKPFGYIRDDFGGAMFFQHEPFDEATQLVCSTAPVYSHAQLQEAVKQERERLAKQWDGCICEGNGRDIGAMVREDAASRVEP